jgi:tripartite-type tricarboxylate transporter receptor subunit TctC
MAAGQHAGSVVRDAALAQADVAEPFAREGAASVPGTPQSFGDLIRREVPRWAEVVKAGHVKAD